MLSVISSFLLKFLSSTFLERIIGYLEKKELNDVEKAKLGATVAVEQLKAEVETRKLQKELIVQENGWLVTRWIIPFIVYPLAIHLNAVILDSIFHLDWKIAKLPSPMDEWQGAIILSYFLVAPVSSIGKNFISYLRKK